MSNVKHATKIQCIFRLAAYLEREDADQDAQNEKDERDDEPDDAPHFEENLSRNGLRSVHPTQVRKGYDQRTLRRETAADLREG